MGWVGLGTWGGLDRAEPRPEAQKSNTLTNNTTNPTAARYERELRKLRAELQRRSKELVDKRRLLEVGGRGFSGLVGAWAWGLGVQGVQTPAPQMRGGPRAAPEAQQGRRHAVNGQFKLH